MRVAIVGPRNLEIADIGKYLPQGTTEIVSGGAKGIDACAARYAEAHGMRLVEFLPRYALYGRAAPLKRNDEIAEYADVGIAFWDGVSKGTAYTIKAFQARQKHIEIILCSSDR